MPAPAIFNGGEKIWFWLVSLFGLVFCVTGFILLFQNFVQGRPIMELSHVYTLAGGPSDRVPSGTRISGTLGMEGLSKA